MAFDLVAEVAALIERFESSGVAYALCGGLTVTIHGHPCITMDAGRPQDLAEIAALEEADDDDQT